jgi:hypothetical protein
MDARANNTIYNCLFRCPLSKFNGRRGNPRDVAEHKSKHLLRVGEVQCGRVAAHYQLAAHDLGDFSGDCRTADVFEGEVVCALTRVRAHADSPLSSGWPRRTISTDNATDELSPAADRDSPKIRLRTAENRGRALYPRDEHGSKLPIPRQPISHCQTDPGSGSFVSHIGALGNVVRVAMAVHRARGAPSRAG